MAFMARSILARRSSKNRADGRQHRFRRWIAALFHSRLDTTCKPRTPPVQRLFKE